jgi:hypothetical protein
MTTLELKYATLRVIRDARGLINTYGWTRKQFGDQQRGYCLVGALYATNSEAVVDEIWGEFGKHFKALGYGEHPAQWNDRQFFFNGKHNVLRMFSEIDTRLCNEILELENAAHPLTAE